MAPADALESSLFRLLSHLLLRPPPPSPNLFNLCLSGDTEREKQACHSDPAKIHNV